jgi:ribosomal protein S12 methylthiotransferase accessory factor
MTGPAPSPVDERTGLIRWVIDVPVEPGEPRLFNAAVMMADVGVYNGHGCYDNNGGSGLSREEARQAAIGEGLERYCCAVVDPGDLLCGSAEELGERQRVRGPADFALYHPRQVAGGPSVDRSAMVAWVPGWSLTGHEAVLVPACLVYMPYAPCFLDRGEQVVAPAVSTGLACATALDDAVLRGLYEVVERDAFMITWMNRLRVPAVDFATHPVLHRMYDEHLRRHGLRYHLFETTTDVPIRSFLCLLVDEMRDPPMICAGGAASLDPVRAAGKAMCEAVQTREWAKFLGRDGVAGDVGSDWAGVRTFEDHVRLYAYTDMSAAVDFLLNREPAHTPPDWRSGAVGESRTDLRTVVDVLAAAGHEAIALDLTTPDVRECGYSVARAIVPQLQPLDASHVHRFLGGHRLYEAPVRMGHAAVPTEFDDLNPCPHPYP